MNLSVTDFKIIFNEEIFTEYNLTKEDFWFDIKFLVNNVYSFDITNLTTEEIYNFIIKIEDILENKDTKIYLDDYDEIYIETTKESIKFYSRFEKSNGIVKIFSSFENNEIVKDEFRRFSTSIKNIVSTWNLNENIDICETLANEISEEFNSIFKHESVKNELDSIKTFVLKHPEIKEDKFENISEEDIKEFKLLLQTYNEKLLSTPDFIKCVKKIDAINDKEDKKKILEIVMSKIKNSII
jgi:hypothetical protein